MPIRNKRITGYKLVYSAIVCAFLLISCGRPLPTSGEDSGVLITHRLKSKIDVEKYKRVLLAGFISSSENSFDIKDIAYENYKRELSKNASFLIIFEKPLELEKNFVRNKARNLDFASANIFEDSALWTNIAEIYKVDLVIAGDISFTNEIRTSVEKKAIYQDGKENTISKIVELKFFALSVTFYFIDGSNGKSLEVKKILKEKGYGKSEEESKNIFLSLIRETIPDISSVIISEREPIRRILLE
jgi:hypothetical protein